MLEFMRIQNFKTLLDAAFPLSNLNIFSGLNGMGKSSLIQTLLLLRQSFQGNTLLERGLLLKGNLVSLGVGQDVLSGDAETNAIEFTVKWIDKKPVSFVFESDSKSDLLPFEKAPTLSEPEKLSLFNSNFQYLSADRIGPKSYYDISEFHIGDLNSLGNNGEYTVHFIAENGSKLIPVSALQNHNARTLGFLENLNAWMSEISPGIRIKAITQSQFNAATLSYSFVQGKDTTADFKPQNVGFGLTYSLPILTAILRAEPGNLLVLENPESHLHPAGQAMVGRLCALAASHGIQLIVESHSDHFLNGVRVAVKDNLIENQKVRLFFLERPGEQDVHSSIIHAPEIDSLGRLDQWPRGFFDEWDKQLEKLV